MPESKTRIILVKSASIDFNIDSNRIKIQEPHGAAMAPTGTSVPSPPVGTPSAYPERCFRPFCVDGAHTAHDRPGTSMLLCCYTWDTIPYESQ